VRHIEVASEIAAPAGRVWEFISEFRHWQAWGITIRRVQSNADRVAPGVTGRVQTVAGVWLPFRICDVIPGEYWIWNVAGIGATGHRVTLLTEETSVAAFTVPWAAYPYRTVLRRSLRKLKQIAEGR
jgi:hypothetical protein